MCRKTAVPLALLLFACVAPADEWTKSFPVQGRAELRVDADDARVEVRPGSGGQIEARVVTTGWEIGTDEVRVIDRQTGDRVELEVRMPRREFFSMGDRSVRVEIRAPSELASQIRTGDGGIDVEGVGGEMRLWTGDGSIRADGVTGALDAATGDGGIRVHGRFAALQLRTGDGAIEAEVEPGSRMEAPWRVQTGDGTVRLRLPRDLAADLDVRSGDGRVTVDLPVTVVGEQRRSSVRGKLNGGGRSFTVRTGDGSIQVQ